MSTAGRVIRGIAVLVGVGAAISIASIPFGGGLGDRSSLFNGTPSEAPCDESVELTRDIPPPLATRGIDAAVGSGDTWFLPPATGRWSQDVRWDAGQYFLKFGVWSLSSKAPVITVRQFGGAHAGGSASSSATTEGLPGPLPTTLRFPTTGCWEVTGEGVSGHAFARILVEPSARDRDGGRAPPP